MNEQKATSTYSGTDTVIHAVCTWLKDSVIGLNLCPFASYPHAHNRIRLEKCLSHNDQDVLNTLLHTLLDIDAAHPDEIETTLLIIPEHFQDFYDFNDFLGLVDALLESEGWVGRYQVASFHPRYQFANTQEEDAENYTNRAPYPILHILRENSLNEVLSSYQDPETIYKKNIKTMNELSDAKRKAIFPYLEKRQDI